MKQKLVLLAVALAFASCNSAPKINTASDLAAAIQARGVNITSQEPAPTPKGRHFRFDEGITAKGDDLWVDILRITDQKVFDLTEDSAGLLILAEAVAGQEFPGKPEVYTRYPFVVVVREQPEDAGIVDLLRTILPPDD